MISTNIYFLRHGEVDNPGKVLYGRLPGFSLSVEGKRRIEEVSQLFLNKTIRHLYSSPLLRARQTAEITGRNLCLFPRISSLLNEVKIYCQGISLDAYKNKIQPRLYQKENQKMGQESVESIKARMLKFLNIMVNKHSGDNILVVSHGDPITILKATLENVSFTWGYKLDNYLKTGGWLKVTCRGLKCHT